MSIRDLLVSRFMALGHREPVSQVSSKCAIWVFSFNSQDLCRGKRRKKKQRSITDGCKVFQPHLDTPNQEMS